MKSNKAMVVHGTTSVDNQIQEHGKGNADVNLFEEVVEQIGWKKEEIFLVVDGRGFVDKMMQSKDICGNSETHLTRRLYFSSSFQ